MDCWMMSQHNSDPFFAGRTFLRTGDLARIGNDGRLFIEGRLKDLIIVAGRNIYPQVWEGTSSRLVLNQPTLLRARFPSTTVH